VYAGYHNMCRWNFRGMLEHPRIRRLDYYCRMDTDSRIKKKVGVGVSELRSAAGLMRASGCRVTLAGGLRTRRPCLTRPA